jgi:tRNA nucleotidyltransferase (CCA-adding enzyme)
MNKYDKILKEVLEEVTPSKEKFEENSKIIKDSIENVREKIKKEKLDVEVFLGGSFAKKTVIKKDYYDADLFLRFDKKYRDEEIPLWAGKILSGFKGVMKIHGSRDYFRIKASQSLFIEVIPVLKINRAEEAKNITDLSYLHVKYINKKIKSEKILDEIRIAKAFCYANNCYGAESYINGFSGYALELLISYYGSFLEFIRNITKVKEKAVIDLEKHYKNKKEVLMNINESKLHSPIILIDPTFKQRNALAALSNETFERFVKVCRDFLKNPSIKSFEVKKTDLEKVKAQSKKSGFEFILLDIETEKQEGDVAGSKLLKFFRHFNEELNRFFEVKNKGFEYNGEKSAECFFVVKPKREILSQGPFIKDIKNVKAFKKEHKRTFVKKNQIYAREKNSLTIREFVSKWKSKNARKIKEMAIKEMKVVG